MMQFPTLQTKYDLPHRMLFSYLQIKSCLKNIHPTKQNKKPSQTLSLYEKFCTNALPPKKVISWCYKTLTRAQKEEKITYKIAWHKELNRTIDDEQWTRAYSSHKDNMDKTQWTTTYHILISAAMVISRLWKSPTTPNFKALLNQINLNWQYETMLSKQHGLKKTISKANLMWKEYWELQDKQKDTSPPNQQNPTSPTQLSTPTPN
ncbi:Hypothetical predicted protein [Pelobates cultripes]|uniref:Uncharacterized protein n=1 Tax=Pelobates cultripes TaxID=61616 RepID=A0AAD1SXP2_PELCU|nr:Hypothetical predicted protein [Pelobates cultripes]